MFFNTKIEELEKIICAKNRKGYELAFCELILCKFCQNIEGWKFMVAQLIGYDIMEEIRCG